MPHASLSERADPSEFEEDNDDLLESREDDARPDKLALLNDAAKECVAGDE